MKEAAQSTRNLMLVRPAAFDANAETAASNSFQGPAPAGGELTAAVGAEFDRLICRLEGAGARPGVFEDLPGGAGPDAVFPNNWVSFHGDGSAILYPLRALNRRPERRIALVQALARIHGFVLDRVLGFHASDRDDRAVYHTNVMMSIGSGWAVCCTDSIPGVEQRRAVLDSLSAGQRARLERHAGLLPVAVPLIERHGGGGARCMLAEIHLPEQASRNEDP